MKYSWKTTVGGAVTALGVYLSSQTTPAWLHTVGVVLMMAGSAFTGAVARDNNVTSAQAGAGK